jgi:transposase
MATLSKYRREFLAGAQASTGGRSSKVSTATQQYITRMVRNDSLDGPRGSQKYLRSINISMSLSGAEKLLNEMGLKPKEKTRPILSVQPTKNSG